jgi:hypothetical protein
VGCGRRVGARGASRGPGTHRPRSTQRRSRVPRARRVRSRVSSPWARRFPVDRRARWWGNWVTRCVPCRRAPRPCAKLRAHFSRRPKPTAIASAPTYSYRHVRHRRRGSASASMPARSRVIRASPRESPDLDDHGAAGRVPGVSRGGMRSPRGGARRAAWFRYASPAINAVTITSATSTSSTVTSVVTLGAPIFPR